MTLRADSLYGLAYATESGGYSPFSDDRSTSRDTAFAKIQARVEGTALAAARLTGRRHGGSS